PPRPRQRGPDHRAPRERGPRGRSTRDRTCRRTRLLAPPRRRPPVPARCQRDESRLAPDERPGCPATRLPRRRTKHPGDVTVRRGIVIGVAGLPTVVPALGPAVFLYGLGLIVWFVWVGIVML